MKIKKLFASLMLAFATVGAVSCAKKDKNFTGIIKIAYITESRFTGFSNTQDGRQNVVELTLEFTEDAQVGQTLCVYMHDKNGSQVYKTDFTVSDKLKTSFAYPEKGEFLTDVDFDNICCATTKVVVKTTSGNVLGSANLGEVRVTYVNGQTYEK